MQELDEMIRGWQQRRCGVAAPRRLIRSSQIIEDMTVLLCERGHHRHHRFHQREPSGLWVPTLPLRQRTPGRMALSAALFVGSTPS